VPVAERRFRLYFAASGWTFAATGGAFITRLWRRGTSKVGLKIPFIQVFTEGRPQMKTKTERTSQGIQPMNASPNECVRAAAPAAWRIPPGEAMTPASRSSLNRQTSFGCQTLSSA